MSKFMFNNFRYSMVMLVCLVTSMVHAAQTASSYTTATRYDTAGRVTGTILPDPDGSGVLKYAATRSSYNAKGLLDTLEHGELSVWKSELIKPSSWSESEFPVFSSEKYYYDSQGRLIGKSIRNKLGQTVSFTQTNYDSLDRVVCQARRINAVRFDNVSADACSPSYSSTHGYDRIVKYTYDNYSQIVNVYKAWGTPLQQVYKHNTYQSSAPALLQSVSDANGNTTSYEYDVWGNVDRINYPQTSYPAVTAYYKTFKYDPNGNLIEERKRSGDVFTYQYDNLNQRTVQNAPQATQKLVFKYDGRGLQLSATKGNYNDKYHIENTYDARGNLKTSSIAEGYYNNVRKRTLSYTYDKNGNRKTIGFPDGQTFKYEFDGLNRIAKIRNPSNTQLLSIAYQKSGTRDSITRIGGATTSYNFDDVNRLEGIQQNFTSSIYDVTNSFAYNAVNQITQIDLSNPGYQYQGNDTRTGGYSVNELNQYTHASGRSVSHDANGNMTNDGHNNRYTFDSENRLVGLLGNDTGTIVYDPNGRLYSTEINGNTTYYLFDGDALVATYNSSNQITERFIHGDQIDEPLIAFTSSSVSTSNTKYLHADHQGSVIAMSNTSGNVVKTNAYDVYGVPATTNDTIFGYTGQIYLKDTELYYYKARIYHPKLGRFLQTDPVGYEDQMNLYAYVGNDPVNMVDPSGETAAHIAAVRGTYRAGKAVGNGINKLTKALTGKTLSVHIAHAVYDIVHNEAGDKDASTPTGSRDSPMDVEDGTNEPTEIGEREYSGHALDRMQGRGVPPTAVEEAIGNGEQGEGNMPGTTTHTDSQNGVKVVTNSDGKVVTVINVGRDK